MSQEGLCATSSTIVGVTFPAGAEVTGDTQEGIGKSTIQASYNGQQGAEGDLRESIEGSRYDGQHESSVDPHYGGKQKQ